jgi:peroxiredoxin
MIMIARLLAAAVLVVAAPVLAEIPAVGVKAPALSAPDSAGKPQTLRSLAGPKGTVLLFFRSAEWCPYCKAQLIDINARAAAALQSRGFGLAALSYDSPAVLTKFAAERGITYPLLSDPKSQVIDGWQLRDPQYKPDSRAAGVPKPAIFVIGKDGRIKARLMEEDYRKRPQVEAVLAAVDAVK